MDLLLSTSSIEGLPNVLIEAQCLGKPVVATTAGGTAEVFEDGATGFLSDSDPASLARHCAYVQADCDLRARLRTVGPALMRSKFSTGALVERLERLYGLALELHDGNTQPIPPHYGDLQRTAAGGSQRQLRAAARLL
jgi:glycosyltransferase involved in cell wall biosynthesis